MTKIEKNVPFPDSRVKYPFADMKPGDSVWIDDDSHRPKVAAFSYARYHGWKVICRKQDGGFRIWRVE